MTIDRKKIYLSSIVFVLVLLGALFLPSDIGRTITALLFIASAIAAFFLVKKRPILSINKKTVFWIMLAMGAMCIVIYYLTGLHFGFYKLSSHFSIEKFTTNLLLIAVIIAATEFIRYVLVAQDVKFVGVFAYLIGVLSDVLLSGGLSQVHKLTGFLDLVGLAFFPAITSNLLYNYISKRYGAAPNIAYRLIMALPAYLLHIVPALDDAIYSFFLMIIPLFVWSFVDTLYEKKPKYASHRKKGIWSIASIGVMVAMMVAIIMLVSGEFRYKFIVIATESMTGAIDKGDAIIYEDYDGQVIEKDTVVVFTKDDKSLIVHRVIDVQRQNGVIYYTTKGDANESPDSGSITSEHLRGVVLYRLPNLGQPTLFLRDLFK